MMTFDQIYGIQRVTGLELHENANLTVARTWRERLWSWPWRPWVARKPDRQVYITPYGMYCHPTVARELKALM